MEFPHIDYKYWLDNWTKSIGEQKTYSNKNMLEFIKFTDDTNSCTEEIFNIVKSGKTDKKSVLRVVDLIYSWGGPSGRLFYAAFNGQNAPRVDLENDESVFGRYLDGIKLAKLGKPESIKIFCKIRGIGASYASKHAYFWSTNSENPLIIVDSKIAGSLGYRTIEHLEAKSNYAETVESFKKKAIIEFNESNPSKIERALFSFHNHYFLNDNSGWKNSYESKDYPEAVRLSKVLF